MLREETARSSRNRSATLQRFRHRRQKGGKRDRADRFGAEGRKSISDRSATLSPSQTEVGARHGRADRFGAESQFQRESKQKPPYIREDSK